MSFEEVQAVLLPYQDPQVTGAIGSFGFATFDLREGSITLLFDSGSSTSFGTASPEASRAPPLQDRLVAGGDFTPPTRSPARERDLPSKSEMLKAAEEGLGQWLHDEVYAANMELYACLLAASKDDDVAAQKKAKEECTARFNARLKAAEANLVQTRKVATEVINELRDGAAPAPVK